MPEVWQERKKRRGIWGDSRRGKWVLGGVVVYLVFRKLAWPLIG